MYTLYTVTGHLHVTTLSQVIYTSWHVIGHLCIHVMALSLLIYTRHTPLWTALSQVLYITLTTLILPSYPFTSSSGSYNYNSIKICKQISTPPQPYQKIPDIYFLRSCTLPNFISIPSPITIEFVVDVFVLYVILYLLLYCLLCYLVLRPQSWINSTTTTTTTTLSMVQQRPWICSEY